METGNRNILVVGPKSPLLEGLADLLEVAGYQVETSSSWAEKKHPVHVRPPGLLVVDLSRGGRDAYWLSEQIRRMPSWAHVPILFVSFSGEDAVRRPLRRHPHGNGGPIDFYAHTLLSMNALVDKVRACLPI